MERILGRTLQTGCIAIAAAVAGIWITVPVALAQSTDRHHIDIPAGDMGKALTLLGQQAEREVVFPADIARGKRSVAVNGDLTVTEALDKLLANTGLSYRLNPTGPIIIEVSQSPLDGSGPRAASQDQGGLPRRSSANAPLEEVIVTAQKREERLQDVPVPVTALSAQSLIDANRLHLQDYFSAIPGLNVSTSSVGGYQLLSIRGITTGLANPSVGVTIDDAPFGSSTVYGGNIPADIDPNELARVEVLRGPQGTLYGASSIGGLIKYVTVDPTTERLSGDLQLGGTSTRNGDGVGYSLSGAFNAPLSSSLALRASAFTREEPGYIDNPVLEIRGVNKNNAHGGHVALLWEPTDRLSLKLSALVQHFKADGSPDVDLAINGYTGPPLGELQQNYIPGAGAYDTNVQAYSATLKAKLGRTDITSISAYSENHSTSSIDFTYIFGPYTQSGLPGTGFNGFGVPGSPLVSDYTTKKLSQELRFSTPLTDRVEWMLGAFYTHEDNSPFTSELLAEDPTTGAIAGVFGTFEQPSTYSEYAAFTNFTFHIAPQWDVQVGGRESHIKQTNQETDTGPYVLLFEGVSSPNVGKEYRAEDNAFTYLLTPQFKVSTDLMLYARFASGYRAGGPNPAIGVPPQYAPDKTYNYELGAKGDVLDHRLSFDASLYYIDWRDIQLTLSDPVSGFTWTGNAGSAKSEGVEVSVEARPTQGLRVAAWIAWNDAVLTEPLPPGYPGISAIGESGDRLPYSSRISGSLSVEQQFPLGRGATGFVGGSVDYVGDRQGPFMASPPRQYFPAYAKADLRCGVKYESWTLNVTLNNVFDRQGLLDGGLGSNIPYDFHYLQPRSLGIFIRRTF